MLQYPILSNHSSQVSATAASCFLGLSLYSAGYCYHSSSGHRSQLTLIQFRLQEWWKELCFNASMILPCMQTSLEPCRKGMPIFIWVKLNSTGWVWWLLQIALGHFFLVAGWCVPHCAALSVFIRYPQPEHVLLITTTLQTDFTAPLGILQWYWKQSSSCEWGMNVEE